MKKENIYKMSYGVLSAFLAFANYFCEHKFLLVLSIETPTSAHTRSSQKKRKNVLPSFRRKRLFWDERFWGQYLARTFFTYGSSRIDQSILGPNLSKISGNIPFVFFFEEEDFVFRRIWCKVRIFLYLLIARSKSWVKC